MLPEFITCTTTAEFHCHGRARRRRGSLPLPLSLSLFVVSGCHHHIGSHVSFFFPFLYFCTVGTLYYLSMGWGIRNCSHIICIYWVTLACLFIALSLFCRKKMKKMHVLFCGVSPFESLFLTLVLFLFWMTVPLNFLTCLEMDTMSRKCVITLWCILDLIMDIATYIA